MFIFLGGAVAVAASLIAVIVLCFLIGMNIKSAGKKSHRVLLIALMCAFLIVGIFGALRVVQANNVIGTYSGAESDCIMIDGVTYVADYDNLYSSKDRDSLLGKVVYGGSGDISGHDPIYVWSVDGTDEYIYALQAYDGTFYKKT